MIRRIRASFFAIVLLTAIIFSFNNCGEGFNAIESQDFASSLSSTTGQNEPDPTGRSDENYGQLDGNYQVKVATVNYLDSNGLPRQKQTEIELINGKALIFGDILVGNSDDFKHKSQYVLNMTNSSAAPFQLGISEASQKTGQIQFFAAKHDKDLIWPHGIVPYQIKAEGYSPKDLDKLAFLIKKFNKKMLDNDIKIQFVPRNNESAFVQINSDPSICGASIGYVPGEITQVYLAKKCLNSRNTPHELIHALGFYHEHNREDRDKHITVNNKNIIDGIEHNFDRLPGVKGHTEYDLNSIMHYGSYFGSKNGEPTMLTIDGEEIVASYRVSPKDLAGLKRVYGEITNEDIENFELDGDIPANGIDEITNVDVSNQGSLDGNPIDRPFVIFNDQLFYQTESEICQVSEVNTKSYTEAARSTDTFTNYENDIDKMTQLFSSKSVHPHFTCPENIPLPENQLHKTKIINLEHESNGYYKLTWEQPPAEQLEQFKKIDITGMNAEGEITLKVTSQANETFWRLQEDDLKKIAFIKVIYKTEERDDIDGIRYSESDLFHISSVDDFKTNMESDVITDFKITRSFAAPTSISGELTMTSSPATIKDVYLNGVLEVTIDGVTTFVPHFRSKVEIGSDRKFSLQTVPRQNLLYYFTYKLAGTSTIKTSKYIKAYRTLYYREIATAPYFEPKLISKGRSLTQARFTWELNPNTITAFGSYKTYIKVFDEKFKSSKQYLVPAGLSTFTLALPNQKLYYQIKVVQSTGNQIFYSQIGFLNKTTNFRLSNTDSR